MTENDIIKALEDSIHKMKECCVTNWDFYASGDFVKNILDLINRQKAEIAELQLKITSYNAKIVELQDAGLNIFSECSKTLEWKEKNHRLEIKQAKSEAIKEFAERLVELGVQEGAYEYVSVYDIDNLVKEMTEVSENG